MTISIVATSVAVFAATGPVGAETIDLPGTFIGPGNHGEGVNHSFARAMDGTTWPLTSDTSGAVEAQAKVSSDGTRVAVLYEGGGGGARPDGTVGIYDLYADEPSIITMLVDRGTVSRAVGLFEWSPDDMAFAVAYEEGASWHIGVAPTDGSGFASDLVTVSTSGLPPLDLEWSPDGSQIAYLVQDPIPGDNLRIATKVTVVDVASGTQRVLDTVPAGFALGPLAVGWSADGASVHYTATVEDGAGSPVAQFRSARIDASSAPVVLHERSGTTLRAFEFSPDGNWMYAQVGTSGTWSPSGIVAIDEPFVIALPVDVGTMTNEWTAAKLTPPGVVPSSRPIVVAGPMDNGEFGASQWPAADAPLSDLGAFSVYATEVRATDMGEILVSDFTGIFSINPSARTFRRIIGAEEGWGAPGAPTPFEAIGEDVKSTPVDLLWEIGRRMDVDPAGRLIFHTIDGIFRVGSDDILEHIAGVSGSATGGDGGNAADAGIAVQNMFVDGSGAIWFLENFGYSSEGDLSYSGTTRVRRVGTDGIIATIAGGDIAGGSGDGGPSADALIAAMDITVDDAGNAFLIGSTYSSSTETSVTTLRRIDAATGIITSVPVDASACRPSDSYTTSRMTVSAGSLRFVSAPWGDTDVYDCSIDVTTGAAQATPIGLTGLDIRSNFDRGPGDVLWWTQYDDVDFANSGLVRLGEPPLGRVPDVEVAVSAPGSIATGAEIGFDIQVTNVGTATATGVAVTVSPDNIDIGMSDSGTTTCSYATGPSPRFTCTLGNLEPGQTVLLDSSATIEPAGSGTLSVEASTTAFDPNFANDSASATVMAADGTPTATADLTVAVSGPSVLNVGIGATYVATVTNRGPDDAADVSVNWNATGGVLTPDNGACTGAPPSCGLGTIAAGATATVQIHVGANGPASITLTADVTSAATEADPADNSDSREVTAVDGADPEGFSGTIVFGGAEGKLYGLTEGRSPFRLTSTAPGFVEFDGALSPDGSSVVIKQAGGVAAIYDVGASEPRRVLDLGSVWVSGIDWATDDTILVAGIDGGGQLLAVPLDGGLPVQLATSETVIEAAASKDGRRVAASLCDWVVELDAQRCRIEVIDLESGNRSIALADELDSMLVDWTSNDQSILFVRWIGDPGRQVWSVPSAGGATRATGIETGEQFATAPSGRLVAISGTDYPYSTPFGWIGVDADGSPRKLFDSESFEGSFVAPVDWSAATVRRTVLDVTGDPGPTGVIDEGCNPAPGDCTLAEAITDSNERDDPAQDVTIVVPPGTVIREPLPPVTKPVTLIGDQAVDDPRDGRDPLADSTAEECGPASYLMGPGIGSAHGLRIATGRNVSRPTVVRGFLIANFGGDGVHVSGSAKVRIRCLTSGTLSHAVAGVGTVGANGGDGFDVADSKDVVLFPSVSAQQNGGTGLEITGNSAGVRSLGASLFDHGGLGIDLGAAGVDRIDVGDLDDGPNALVNRPTLLRVGSGATSAQRRVFARVSHTPANEPFRVDYYLNAWCDPTGSGEAMNWLGAAVYRDGVPANGVVHADLAFPVPLHLVAATVTTADGTSELSDCLHRNADADPGLDTTTTSGPTTTIQRPTDPTTGVGDRVGDPSGLGDGIGGGRPPTDVGDGGDDGVGGADPGLGTGWDGDAPSPDNTPATDGYIMAGQQGQITVDAPGLLSGQTGDGPFQAIKETGGDMPANAWSLTANGVITLDATNLAAGSYTGRFSVVDRDGDSSGLALILFLVLDADGTLPDLYEEDPSTEAVPRPDTYEMNPGSRATFSSRDAVLANDFPGNEATLTSELVDAGPLGNRLTLSTDGTVRVDARGLAEGTYSASYRLRAGGLDRGTTSITVIVDDGNSCPTPVGDTYRVRAGERFEAAGALGVLGNDTDPDGDRLTAKLVGEFARKDISLGADGTVKLDARSASPGTFREFEYIAVDAKGNSCGTATVRLEVHAGVAPTANLDYFEVHAGQKFDLPSRGILGNDFDPDGSELALVSSLVSGPDGWRVKVAKDGGVTATVPKKTAVDTVVSATYRVTDDLGQTADGEIRFRVVAKGSETKIPSAPRVSNDTHYRVHAGDTLVVPASAGVLANDTPSNPDLAYAESPSEGSNGARFTLGRDGSFVLETSLSDSGKTITQSYYSILKGYAGVRSKSAATVRIEVVPPRVECTTGEAGIDLTAEDDDEPATQLLTATIPFTYCHDDLTVTDAWYGPGSSPFDYDRSTAMEVADTVFFGWKVELENTRNNTSLSGSGGSRQLEFTAQYRLCVDALDFVPLVFRGLRVFSESIILGKTVKFLTGKFGGGTAFIDNMVGAMRWIDDSLNAAGFVADKLRGTLSTVPFFGGLLKIATSAPAGWIRAIVTVVSSTAIKVAYKGTTKELRIAEMLDQWVGGDVEDLGEFTVLANSSPSCALLSNLHEAYDDAFGTARFTVHADGSITNVSSGAGPFGFMDWFTQFVWMFDPSRDGEPIPEWEQIDPSGGETAYRTCDFTRVWPTDVPARGESIDGEPIVPCNSVTRRR